MQTGASFEKIVLITDSKDYCSNDLTVFDRNIDRVNVYYTNQLFKAIQAFHHDVVLYNSPQELIDNIHMHRNDLVFPFWFGENSRNRHAIIPAICEGANIRYLGGDAYTKIVCNDKNLSKLLCKKAGLLTPNGSIIVSSNDYNILNEIYYPIVVKPLFEGTSLGISDKNLVFNKVDAIKIIEKLIEVFNQPILIEEFVSGKEVSICLVGWKNKVVAWEAAERFMDGDDDYFINKLYTYVEKKSSELPLFLRSVKSQITKEVYTSCVNLFSLLDKVEFMRIDGRLNNTEFTVIELTPETHLGDDAEFCGAFIAGGNFTYNSIVKLLIENCLERYQSQNASM